MGLCLIWVLHFHLNFSYVHVPLHFQHVISFGNDQLSFLDKNIPVYKLTSNNRAISLSRYFAHESNRPKSAHGSCKLIFRARNMQSTYTLSLQKYKFPIKYIPRKIHKIHSGYATSPLNWRNKEIRLPNQHLRAYHIPEFKTRTRSTVFCAKINTPTAIFMKIVYPIKQSSIVDNFKRSRFARAYV